MKGMPRSLRVGSESWLQHSCCDVLLLCESMSVGRLCSNGLTVGPEAQSGDAVKPSTASDRRVRSAQSEVELLRTGVLCVGAQAMKRKLRSIYAKWLIPSDKMNT